MSVQAKRIATSSTAAAFLGLLAGRGTLTTTASSPAASSTVSSPSHNYTGSAATMPTSMMATGKAMASTGPMSTAGMPMPAQPDGPHNQADVTFAQQMTAHHQGAITMADLAPTRATSPKAKIGRADQSSAGAGNQRNGQLARRLGTGHRGHPRHVATKVGQPRARRHQGFQGRVLCL